MKKKSHKNTHAHTHTHEKSRHTQTCIKGNPVCLLFFFNCLSAVEKKQRVRNKKIQATKKKIKTHVREKL